MDEILELDECRVGTLDQRFRQTREVSVTCDWDADGDRGRYTNFNVANADKFITCRSN